MNAYHNVTNLSRSTVLEVHTVDDDLVLVRETTSYVVSASTGPLKINLTQYTAPGECNPHQARDDVSVVEHAMRPIELANRLAGEDYSVLNLLAASSEFIEKVRTVAASEHSEWKNYENARTDVYTAVVDDGLDPDHNLIRFDYSASKYYNRFDQPLPTAVYVHADSGLPITTEFFSDPVAVADILAERTDIVFTSVEHGQIVRGKPDRFWPGVSFIWTPSSEDYRKIHEAGGQGGPTSMTTALRTTDFFGIGHLGYSDEEIEARDRERERNRLIQERDYDDSY